MCPLPHFFNKKLFLEAKMQTRNAHKNTRVRGPQEVDAIVSPCMTTGGFLACPPVYLTTYLFLWLSGSRWLYFLSIIIRCTWYKKNVHHKYKNCLKQIHNWVYIKIKFILWIIIHWLICVCVLHFINYSTITCFVATFYSLILLFLQP